MAGRKEIRQLSDSELLNELRSFGLKTGPISPTTRRIYEKKLSKARGCFTVDSKLNKDPDKLENVEEDSCRNLSLTDGTHCTNSVSSESSAIFYGVCFDVNRSSSGCGFTGVPAGRTVVFTSKEEALNAAKKFKGARFKAFKTRSEAEVFSRSQSVEQENSSAMSSSLASPTDPVSNFKGPTPQELVKFRAVIEHGTQEEFLEIVFKNPRYLIGPGDTPVILQEGFRYNAIHVAANKNRKDMCQLIIDTLESQCFWNILLNQDTGSSSDSQRKRFLVDMYLNTPDKGNLETPLHFACKYGHVEVVEYLMSHPLTDMQRTNKYGETPAQVICSRCSAACSDKKSKIQSYLEDNCFVPLLGSLDNSTPPWIGEPWSPEVTDVKNNRESGSLGSPLDNLKERNSPGEPPVTVRAYAGPMSPSKAEEFYHSWKTPPKMEHRKSYIYIKRKDDSRGIERIGRQLAHNGRIPWTEYWSFLGGYADLSKLQGMEKLEDYLGKKKERLMFNRLSVTPKRVRVPKSTSGILRTPESRQSSVILGDNELSQETERTKVNNQYAENGGIGLRDSHYLTMRKTLFSNSVESENATIEGKSEIMLQNSRQCGTKENVSRDNTSPLMKLPVSCVTDLVEKLTENFDELSLTKEQDRSEELLSMSLTGGQKRHDLLTCDIDFKDDRGVEDGSVGLPCQKKLSFLLPETEDDKFSANAPMEMDTHASSKLIEENVITASDNPLLNFANEISSLSSSSSMSSSLTLDCPLWEWKDDEVFDNLLETDAMPSNQCHEHSSDVEVHEFKVPVNRNLRRIKCQSYSHALSTGNEDISIFIQGSQPTKLDLDVLISIGKTKVDSEKFPNISKWKRLIMSFSEEKQKSWPSPGSPRCNVTRNKSLMWSC